MSFWSNLPVHSFIDGVVWYDTSVFFQFLKSNSKIGDDEKVHQFQLLQNFSRKNNWLKKLADKSLICLEGMVAYCIDKQLRHSGCKTIALDVVSSLTDLVQHTQSKSKPLSNSESHTPSTSSDYSSANKDNTSEKEMNCRDLYLDVSSFDFNMSHLHWAFMLESTSLQDENMTYVYFHLKNDPKLSWYKVLFFEWHFALYAKTLEFDVALLGESSLLKEKFYYLEQLRSLKHVSSQITKDARMVCKRHAERRKQGSTQNDSMRVTVNGEEHLMPFLLDSIHDCLKNDFLHCT